MRLPKAPRLPKPRKSNRVMVKTQWHTAAETRYINASRKRARDHFTILAVAIAALIAVLIGGGL